VSEERGGHWNRAGRRGGGARKTRIDIVPVDIQIRCAVPDCAAPVTMRVPVTPDSPGATPVDGKWWVGMCAEHGARLLAEAEPSKEGGAK